MLLYSKYHKCKVIIQTLRLFILTRVLTMIQKINSITFKAHSTHRLICRVTQIPILSQYVNENYSTTYSLSARRRQEKSRNAILQQSKQLSSVINEFLLVERGRRSRAVFTTSEVFKQAYL